MSRPSTPVKVKAPMDPKITWAPIRKQKDFELFILGTDYQPQRLIHPMFTSITEYPMGGAGDVEMNQLTNNMNSQLNINSSH